MPLLHALMLEPLLHFGHCFLFFTSTISPNHKTTNGVWSAWFFIPSGWNPTLFPSVPSESGSVLTGPKHSLSIYLEGTLDSTLFFNFPSTPRKQCQTVHDGIGTIITVLASQVAYRAWISSLWWLSLSGIDNRNSLSATEYDDVPLKNFAGTCTFRHSVFLFKVQTSNFRRQEKDERLQKRMNAHSTFAEESHLKRIQQ